MTPTLQDLIDSAKLCGYRPTLRDESKFGGLAWVKIDESDTYWNPPENPVQDREIRDVLLAKGWQILYWRNDQGGVVSNPEPSWHYFKFDCPANDFLTLAGAHVYRREHGD